MKIVLTGGATGGHFYPLISVAEAIEDVCAERVLIEPELIYSGPPPLETEILFEHDIQYSPSKAATMRSYRGIANVFSIFSIAIGVVRATIQLFNIYPDVVFSTGSFAAFPTLVAAKLLRVPVVIYDADASPGRVSLWSSKFARWIAVAHPDAAEKFPASVRSKIARVGHPIRKEIMNPAKRAVMNSSSSILKSRRYSSWAARKGRKRSTAQSSMRSRPWSSHTTSSIRQALLILPKWRTSRQSS